MQKCLLLFSFLLLAGGLRAQCEGVNPDCSIINDYECQNNYGGVPMVANPAPDAVNSSSMVGEFTDLNDAYDASVINFLGPIDLSVNNILRLQIYTEAAPAGRLLAILEGGTSPQRQLAIAGIADGAWTEYTFDFSAFAGENHTNLVLIFNADITRTNGPETYFLDNIRWEPSATGTDPCAGATPEEGVLNDFECQQNEPFQACFPVVDNPLVSPDNTSARVGCFTDFGGEFDNIFIQFDGPIDLSTNNQLSIKVNTTQPGELRAKLEGGTGATPEIGFTLAGNGTWETATYDFSAAANEGNTRLVLFFNFNQVANGEKYFIDDIVFEAALPATLGSFTAVPAKDDVVLAWTTLTESAVADYAVEHLTQNGEWTAIGAVPAAGDSQTERRYDLTHQGPGQGEHLYRLRTQDLDGSVAYSDVVSVLLGGGADLRLAPYPNPFTGELSVPFVSAGAGVAHLTLNDLLGRTVARRSQDLTEGANVLRLTDLHELPLGTYLLRVDADGQSTAVVVVRE